MRTQGNSEACEECWTLFVPEVMFASEGVHLRVEDRISTTVVLKDGAASGWPTTHLRDVLVRGEALPRWAHEAGVGQHASLVRAGRLVFCQEAPSSAEGCWRVQAGLEASWFNPSLTTQAVGQIEEINLVFGAWRLVLVEDTRAIQSQPLDWRREGRGIALTLRITETHVLGPEEQWHVAFVSVLS